MLPDLIEIVPLDRPVRAEITVPGSKSITNRALILAALAEGETTLRGALWSEDTQVMADCLEKLGFTVTVKPDPDEFCNRTITVKGLGGKVPSAGTADKPLELFVGNAGTAARFLSAFVCLGNGVYRLHGVPRMHERPQAALFKALRELGYRVDSPDDKLPAVIFGTGPRTGKCTVSIEESSQFASALLLCANVGGWEVDITGENAEESPYVAMTSKMIEAFPKNGGTYQVEPDASSGSYFLAAREVAPAMERHHRSERHGVDLDDDGDYKLTIINVNDWPTSGFQIDGNFPAVFILPGNFRLYHQALLDDNLEKLHQRLAPRLEKPTSISRRTDLGDSIMTAVILSAISSLPLYVSRPTQSTRFIDLGRLRHQETERVVALRNELTKCGAKVIEEGDTLTVYPSELHGAEIETYNDHRMAMCFAILGLKVPGIKIKNPACVKKTFPNFFQKLAAAPPKGLGATILDAKTGRKLEEAELFAD
jgi:3-phosphoshikimate 1-carboxyvinyltransferase